VNSGTRIMGGCVCMCVCVCVSWKQNVGRRLIGTLALGKECTKNARRGRRFRANESKWMAGMS
jgi:hypothetical protein